MKFEAEIKEMPAWNVVCVRHVGPYPGIGKAIERVFQWAGQKGLIQFPKTQVLAVYHDDPQKVDVAELRSDACVTVPEGTPVDGNVNAMTIPGGRFAVAHVEIDVSEYGDAWEKLVSEWMPAKGLNSDTDRMCYELYLNDPDKHPEKKHVVDICEPILDE